MTSRNDPLVRYRTKVLLLIGITGLIRFALLGTTELGNVEVYYWSWSVHPQLNYADHPPMVAWMIGLTTFGQLLVNEYTVRLGPVLALSAGTWISFRIGALLRGERVGWYSALLFNTCIFTGFAAGAHVLPDSPQLIFWPASLFVALKIVAAPGNSHSFIKWLLFGILSGLCILSKVHGAFLWVGLVSYCLLYDRSHFKTPALYCAAIITTIIVSPVIAWNIQHDWYTWKFQSSRVGIAQSHLDIARFFRQLGGVIFTVGPIHFFLVWRCIYRAARHGVHPADRQLKLLYCSSLPLIGILLFLSFFHEVYNHWTGPAYAALLYAAALELATKRKKDRAALPSVLKACVVYCSLIFILQPILINYLPGTSSDVKEGLTVGRGDATVDMVGWKETGNQYEDTYRQLVMQKSIRPNTPVLITGWTPGAAVEFYMARRTGQQVLGIGSLDSLHQYYFTNREKGPLRSGGDAFYIAPSNHVDSTVVQQLSDHFDSAVNVLTVPVYRGDQLCKQTYIFLLKNYDGRRIDLR